MRFKDFIEKFRDDLNEGYEDWDDMDYIEEGRKKIKGTNFKHDDLPFSEFYFEVRDSKGNLITDRLVVPSAKGGNYIPLYLMFKELKKFLVTKPDIVSNIIVRRYSRKIPNVTCAKVVKYYEDLIAENVIDHFTMKINPNAFVGVATPDELEKLKSYPYTVTFSSRDLDKGHLKSLLSGKSILKPREIKRYARMLARNYFQKVMADQKI